MITEKEKKVIGGAETVLFPEVSNAPVHARIDSGARTSAIWGEAAIDETKQLVVTFYGDKQITHTFSQYGKQVVASSNGHTDTRFAVKLLVVVAGRKIRATFTIANRATQVYPVLIGRNVLRGKFVVDVKINHGLKQAEKERIEKLQSLIKKEE
jgi:hypothetical protein